MSVSKEEIISVAEKSSEIFSIPFDGSEKQHIRRLNKIENILKKLKNEGSVIERKIGFFELNEKRIDEIYSNYPWIKFGKKHLKEWVKVRGGQREIEKARDALFGPSKQKKEKLSIINIIRNLEDNH